MCNSSVPPPSDQPCPPETAGHPSSTQDRRRLDRGLSRHQRIPRPGIFREAFAHMRGCRGRYMIMWLRPAPDSDRRLGVVAAKRTFRRAVDRAKAKRALREAYRLNRYRMKGRQDVVVVARRAVLGASLRDVESDLLNLLRRTGAMDNADD